MRGAWAAAWVAIGLVARNAAAQPAAAPGAAGDYAAPDADSASDSSSRSGWLWIGAAAGATSLAAGAALAYWWVRTTRQASSRMAPVPAADKLPPTQPGEPAAAHPFATLPETRLAIVRGLPSEDRYYRVATSPFSIGADPGNQLVIDAPHVSGLHATLELLPDGVVHLVDQSRNGTYVDGTRVPRGERVRINHGQRIGFSRDVEVRLEQPSLQARDLPKPMMEPAAAGEPNPARRAETVLGQPKPRRNAR